MSVPKRIDTIPATPTSDTLSSIYPLIHERCSQANLNFLKCKDANGDPAECLSQGAEVKSCVENVLEEARSSCGPSLEAYRKCLYRTHNDFSDCRKVQDAFYKCWSNHVTDQNKQQ